MQQYNVNNPAVKRILREVKEMEAEPSEQYYANPLEVFLGCCIYYIPLSCYQCDYLVFSYPLYATSDTSVE